MTGTDLVTFKSFLSHFWEEYRSGRFRSQEDVFDYLDGIYFEQFGEHRFPSFDAFRKARDRRYHKKRK